MDVISILERLSSEISCRLMMVGEGPEKIKALDYVEKKGLSDKILFLGNSNEIDKIPPFLSLFIISSKNFSGKGICSKQWDIIILSNKLPKAPPVTII